VRLRCSQGKGHIDELKLLKAMQLLVNAVQASRRRSSNQIAPTHYRSRLIGDDDDVAWSTRSILLRCLMAAGLRHLDTTPCLRRALPGSIDAMPKKTASIRP
jgi:hypothetical protein